MKGLIFKYTEALRLIPSILNAKRIEFVDSSEATSQIIRSRKSRISLDPVVM